MCSVHRRRTESEETSDSLSIVFESDNHLFGCPFFGHRIEASCLLLKIDFLDFPREKTLSLCDCR